MDMDIEETARGIALQVIDIIDREVVKKETLERIGVTESGGEVVTLHASELLSKYGFSDGDLMADWLDRHDLPADDADALLVRVVLRWLVPEIAKEHPIMVAIWETAHNPIRYAEPDDPGAYESPDVEIEGVSIEVSDEDVMIEYRRMVEER